MKHSEFDRVLTDIFNKIEEVLGSKAEEYATHDRLHNFKVAAQLQGVTPSQALAGMMAKHSVSVYDMASCMAEYSKEMWDEKIIDHINYLILLKAIVEEEHKEIFDAKSITTSDNIEDPDFDFQYSLDYMEWPSTNKGYPRNA